MKFSQLHLPQFIRFGIVGAALNLIGYLLYLVVTWLGVEPKLAITFFYPLGVLYGYFVHKRLSFRHASGERDIWLIVRYLFVYALGYLLNIGALYAFHDHFGFPHQLVQVVIITSLSFFFFFSLKFFVFTQNHVAVTDSH